MNFIKFKLSCCLQALLLLFPSVSVLSQPNNKIFNTEFNVINLCADSIKKSNSDSIKQKLNNIIESTLIFILKDARSYKINLDTLKHIGKVYSTDNKFRMISWNIPLNDGTHNFDAIIQMNPEKDSFCTLFPLMDSSRNYLNSISNLNFTAEKWYGALYYEILNCKIDKKVVYVLLGMHFNDLFTNRKIIESMYFNEKGQPVFGFPIFQYNEKIYNRIVFDYSVNAVMNLKYEKQLKMIIFDHLSPPSPLYAGNYKYYGPDFSFDGFKFEKDKWLYHSNVDFRKARKK